MLPEKFIRCLKPYRLWKTLLLSMAFTAVLKTGGYAAPVQGGIQAEFVKNYTSVESNEVVSNILRLRNFSGKTAQFTVEFSLPRGWSMLGQNLKTIEIPSSDSVFLPVRIISDKTSKGGTSYVVTAALRSENGMQFASQNWYVSIPARSNWNVRLPVKNHFFINGIDSSAFLLRVTNEGNTDEDIRFTMVPDRRLEILRAADGGAAPLTFSIFLASGTDTNILIPVIRKASAKSKPGRDADLNKTIQRESYSIQVLAKAGNSKSSWSGSVRFSKTGDIARMNDYKRAALPLTVEANIYDVLSTGTTVSLDAYGNTILRDNAALNYRFQTVFITNYLDENSFLGNNHYIGYFGNRLSVEAGEINGWGRSMLTGKGLKASYKSGINTVGAMATRSPGFFSNYSSQGYGVFHSIDLKKLAITNYYSRNESKVLNVTGNLYNTFIGWKINPSQQVALGGGYSNDKYSNYAGNGYGYDFGYSGTFNRVNISLSNSYGSPQYTLGRGIKMLSTRMTYYSHSRYNYSLSTQNYSQTPQFFQNNILVNGAYIRSDRYEARLGINGIHSSVYLKPLYQWDENQFIRVSTKAIGVEYNAKNISHDRFSISGQVGYSKAVDYQMPEFFNSRISVFSRWEKLFLSVRYTYGPVQLAEQMRFVKDRINPQSLNVVGSYDEWLKGEKLLLSTTASMMYETYFKKVNFRIRPEIFYYTKSNIRLSAYASFMNSSQGANPLIEEGANGREFQKVTDTELNIGFGIRKQFGVPIPGKKYVTIHAVIFKDLNGNHIQDPDEPGMENMLVNIRPLTLSKSQSDSSELKYDNGEDFISSELGTITYENIPPGIYAVKCLSLVPGGDWFNGGEIQFKADGKNKLLIPMTRGVRITGALLVEKDKYSVASDVPVSRIRISAIDSTGKTFSALTDNMGNFTLTVPSGKYTISVNESALGDNFSFIQNRIHIDLTRNFENFSVSFNAVERKRQMEIKRFGTGTDPRNK